MASGIEEGLDRCARFGVKPGLGAIAEVASCKSLEEALSSAPDGTVVCGSLFLAGEALAATGVLPGGVCGAFPNETFVSA